MKNTNKWIRQKLNEKHPKKVYKNKVCIFQGSLTHTKIQLICPQKIDLTHLSQPWIINVTNHTRMETGPFPSAGTTHTVNLKTIKIINPSYKKK
jgi:hypothetical protein